MRLLSIICLCLFASACGEDGAIGDKCSADTDCETGLVCVPIADCGAKMCTMVCNDNDQCPAVFEGPDCDPIDGYDNMVCLYGEWDAGNCP